MAYNLLDLTTSVQDDLKDPSFSSTRIRRYLNHAQRVIFNLHDLNFVEKAFSGTLTVGVYTYEQQTDHQATIGGALIDPDTNSVIDLNENNYLASRDFFNRYGDVSIFDNGQPSEWTEFGDQIYFNRPADKAYEFIQRYYRVPTDMESDSDAPDVPVAFREVLELWALYRAEKYRGNHDIAATYRQEFDDELEALIIHYAPVVGTGPTISRQTRRRV